MIFRFLLLLFFISSAIFYPAMTSGQKCSVSGVVKDKKTNETLVGASVIIQGTTIGTTTDINGNFTLQNLKPDVYTLEISYISFKKEILKNIKLTPEKPLFFEIKLEEDAKYIEGVVVKERRKTDTDISVINTIKQSNIQMTGLSRQQISRSMDKNAAEAIRRVPGITIIDDKFIIVRGLIDRYNSVLLNQTSTPSFETDKKSFSFDIIPSSTLDRLIIYKSPAPELPADFAGAAVLIYTKNSPEADGLTIGYTCGFRESVTFNDFKKYKGGKTDWLGFDDGTRKLPDIFPATEELENLLNWEDLGLPPDTMAVILKFKRDKLAEAGRSFNKTWTADDKTALNDNSIDIEFNKRLNFGEYKLSNISSLIYKNEYDINDIINQKFAYNEAQNLYDSSFRYNDKEYINEITAGLLENISLVTPKGHVYEFNNLLNQVGISKYTIREGKDFYREAFVRATELSYMSRTIYAGQLRGSYKLRDSKSSLEWIAGYSRTKRSDPDIRRIYSKLNVDTSNIHYNQYEVQFLSDATPELNGRLFLELDENVKSGAVNYKHKFSILGIEPELKTGLYFENKYRTFSARNIGFVQAKSNAYLTEISYLPYDEIYADTNINYPNGIMVDEKTDDKDSYKVDNLLVATYVGLDIPIGPLINVYTGARIEKYHLKLYDFYKDKSADSLDVIRDTINIFPSINITYDLNEKLKLRAAYGYSINRPEFREIAPYSFYDFVTASQMYGWDSLKSAYIHNYDLRLELYPSVTEIVTLGVFYKSFINPIENSIIPVTTDKFTFRPENAGSAKSFGLEADIKKSFVDFGKKSGILRQLKYLTLVFNASYIFSEVTEREGKAYVREGKRPMQGQSPYIINTGIYYDNIDNGWQASLLYNIIGKRIVFVGEPNTPHTYELPRNLMEVLIAKKIGEHLKIKFGIEDIFNDPVQFVQTMEGRSGVNPDGSKEIVKTDFILKEFRPGRKVSFGFSYTF